MTAVPTHEAFEALAAPLRPGLTLHCYRLLGSLHEAEDAVQDSYLRAWRSFERFDGRAFRGWLYRIATNACLNALDRRKHGARLLPDQRGPSAQGGPLGEPLLDVAWLEPYPDARLGVLLTEPTDPEARYSSREAVQLAFVAALQVLPPRQRAALLLCDVLGWTAAEAGEALEASAASVSSALQRARETFGERFPGSPAAPSEAHQQLLGRYLRAWEEHDVDALVALLREDANAVMPPWGEWFAGRAAIHAFFAVAWRSCHGLRLVQTAANGQPAFAVYQRGASGAFEAHSLHVLALEGGAISAMTLFVEPRLVAAFGLPAVLTG